MKYHNTAICPFAKFALFSGFFSVFAGQASFWLQSAVLSLQNLRSVRARSWTQSNLIQYKFTIFISNTSAMIAQYWTALCGLVSLDPNTIHGKNSGDGGECEGGGERDDDDDDANDDWAHAWLMIVQCAPSYILSPLFEWRGAKSVRTKERQIGTIALICSNLAVTLMSSMQWVSKPVIVAFDTSVGPSFTLLAHLWWFKHTPASPGFVQ